MTIGSGMPDIGGGVLTEPQISPGPDNLQIVAPQIGEPTLAGENPDFIADYIFCNNLYVRNGISGQGVSFPLLAPTGKPPIPYSFQAQQQTGMYMNYDSVNDTYGLHLFTHDPSWYDTDLFTDRGSLNLNAPGGSIAFYLWGTDFNNKATQRFLVLNSWTGAGSVIGIGGTPVPAQGSPIQLHIENQLNSDICFKSAFAGGFGIPQWVMTGDITASGYPTGGHLVPYQTGLYDIGATSPAPLFVRKGYINAVQLGNGCSSLLSGSGVPAAGLGVNGDVYFRVDSTAGASLYVKRSGAWAAATGV